RENQPCPGARRRAGHRQGHTAGAREAGNRAVELSGSLTARSPGPLQRLPEKRDPAHQQGPRPGESDRFSFYEHMKVYTAAPPEVLPSKKKHPRKYQPPRPAAPPPPQTKSPRFFFPPPMTAATLSPGPT